MSSSKRPWMDNWDVVKPLGKGGQGETSLVRSKAEPVRLGVLKALKNNKSKQARGRMKIEVTNLDTLSFQGIKVPAVYESNIEQFKEEGVPLYFIMEYVEGETLAELIAQKGPLPLERAAELVFGLGATIQAAHKMGVLHRDLKPANILVRSVEPPDLVVLDYGLSFNSVDEEEEPLTFADEQFRNEFLALGETNTPGGNRRDPRIDITALCAVFYFVLTGHVPGHIVDGRARPPHTRDASRSIRHHLSQDQRCIQVELVLDRGFALDIEHRFQSCEEFLSRLRHVLDSPTDKPEDPGILAARLGEQLNLRDRRTQLVHHKQAATQVNRVIHEKFLRKHIQKIDPFALVGHAGMVYQGQDFPGDIDKLGVTSVFLVSSSVHGLAREIIVSFGAAGNQTVMLVRTVAKSTMGRMGPAAIESGTNWEKIVWFTPQAIPSESELVTIMERELNKAIEEVGRTILGNRVE